jgi:hypothetical protein
MAFVLRRVFTFGRREILILERDPGGGEARFRWRPLPDVQTDNQFRMNCRPCVLRAAAGHQGVWSPGDRKSVPWGPRRRTDGKPWEK